MLLYDKRDVEFALFEDIEIQSLTRFAKYEDFNHELFQMVLDEAFKFASEKLEPRNRIADEEGCTLEDGNVRVPAAYEEIFDDFCNAGWYAPVHNPEFGGQGLPKSLGMGLTEFFIAANPSFMFTPGLGHAAGHLIEVFGTDKQRAEYVENMYTGVWGGTMCLTEPQAGSAVGELSTTAEPVEGEDYYLITGNKIFISAGDHQLCDNIVHLVLARAKGDPAGIKGISLFAVPKFRSDGTPNDVRVTGIEEKMGIHASPTCALSFGDDGDSRGWLIGERCQGIVYMFQMMNEARLVTGLQGSAIGNGAYSRALDYAKERRQGPKVTDRDPNAGSVAIIEHPDVRRNLMTCKAYGEAIRALLLRTAYLADVAELAEGEEATKAHDLVELLTPVCKAFATDVGFKMTELAMQVHGGYGYISEYHVEQAMRDVKIASIYEGTNGIQALDLLGRKMRMKGGGVFLTWLQDANDFLEQVKSHPELGRAAAEVEGAKNAVAEAGFGFGASGKEDPEYPLLHATPFLRLFGLTESGTLLLRQALVAWNKLEELWEAEGISGDDVPARETFAANRDDVRFYENKLATAKFFAHQLVPEAHGILRAIQSGDRSALEVAF